MSKKNKNKKESKKVELTNIREFLSHDPTISDLMMVDYNKSDSDELFGAAVIFSNGHSAASYELSNYSPASQRESLHRINKIIDILTVVRNNMERCEPYDPYK